MERSEVNSSFRRQIGVCRFIEAAEGMSLSEDKVIALSRNELVRFSPARLWRNQPAGPGLRNQVGYPEIKATCPAREASAPPESSPGLVWGPAQLQVRGTGSWRREQSTAGWRASGSPGPARAVPSARQQHIWSGACSAARSAAAGAPKVLGWMRAVGLEPAAPPSSVSRRYSGLKHLPCALRSPDQAETLPGKSVLCFLSVASPGAELHRKEEVADERHPWALFILSPSKASWPQPLTLSCHPPPQSRGFPA